MLTKLFGWLDRLSNKKVNRKARRKQTLERVVVPRADHPISRKQINASALKVLYRLQTAGFEAYLVGGGGRSGGGAGGSRTGGGAGGGRSSGGQGGGRSGGGSSQGGGRDSGWW